MISTEQNFQTDDTILSKNNVINPANSQKTILVPEKIQMVSGDQESTTFIRSKDLSRKITHIKYQWVTDPNTSKIIDRSLIPSSLIYSLEESNQLKNINLIGVEDESKIVIVFQKILNLILEQINSKKFTGLMKGKDMETPLSKGLKKYLYYLEYNPDLKTEYQKISDLINLINYPPLILSVDESKFSILPGERDEYTTTGQAEYIRLQAIAGLRTIIQALVRKKEQLPVRNVIQETVSTFKPQYPQEPKLGSKIILTYTPHDQNNQMIYVSREEKKEYEVFHPLELYYGWRYLSDSPLTLYVIKNSPFNPPIRKIEGIYAVPTMSVYNASFNQATLEIENLIGRGYLALNLEMPNFRILDHSLDQTSFMDHRTEIYSNLITRFEHKMITDRTDYIFNITSDNKNLFKWCELINTCMSNDSQSKQPKNLSIQIIMYGPRIIQANPQADDIGFLSSWLDDSVDNIIHNKLPMVTFRGAWQGIGNGSMNKTLIRLKYVAYIVYHDLVEKYKYLSSSVLLVDVLEDLSIVAPLTSREEMTEFKTELERILFQDNYKGWSIFPVTTQLELVATRLVVLEKFPQVSTFAFGTRRGDKKLIYLVANQRIDPILLDDINDLSAKYLREYGAELNYYLENVPITNSEKSNNDIIKYVNRNAFLRSYDTNASHWTLFSMENNTSASDWKGSVSDWQGSALGDTVTPKTLSRMIFHPEGLMGLFDTNLFSKNTPKEILLKGLYKNPPSQKLAPVDFGRVVVEGFLPADTFRNEWIMTVNVRLYKDDDKQFRIIPLFDLSYRRLNIDPQGKTEVVDYSSGETKNPPEETQKLSKQEQDFVKEIENVTNWLWKRGMFISSWGKAMINNKKVNIETEVEPYGLIEINNILKDGYQEPDSGERAVNYLNQMVKSS